MVHYYNFSIVLHLNLTIIYNIQYVLTNAVLNICIPNKKNVMRTIYHCCSYSHRNRTGHIRLDGNTGIKNGVPNNV